VSNALFRCALRQASAWGGSSWTCLDTRYAVSVWEPMRQDISFGKYFSRRPPIRESLVDDDSRSYPCLKTLIDKACRVTFLKAHRDKIWLTRHRGSWLHTCMFLTASSSLNRLVRSGGVSSCGKQRSLPQQQQANRNLQSGIAGRGASQRHRRQKVKKLFIKS